MNPKSQLDWFYTLPNLLKNDSGYLKIEWQIINRAKANVVRLSQQQNIDREAIVARVLYQNLSSAVSGDIIIENWTAFLSRYSARATNKIQKKLIATGSSSSQELTDTYEELFLTGLTFAAEPILFLKNFSCKKTDDDIWYKILHGYCQKKLQGKIIDYLRTKEGFKTFMRSNLGLAARASEARIIDSLMLAGVRDLEKYLIIWRCFIEVKNDHNIDTKSPQKADFELIINRINYLQKKGKIEQNIFSLDLENCVRTNLEEIGKAIRYYTNRPTVSLDKPASSDIQNPLLDFIPDNNTITDSELTSVEQNSTLDSLTIKVYEHLEQMDRLQWIVLFLRELVGIKQTEIAVMIGSSQKTVSLKYRKSWQELIKKVIP